MTKLLILYESEEQLVSYPAYIKAVMLSLYNILKSMQNR